MMALVPVSALAPSRDRLADKRVLDPAQRIPEVLFGLIMVLTFTGSLSIATVRDLLRRLGPALRMHSRVLTPSFVDVRSRPPSIELHRGDE